MSINKKKILKQNIKIKMHAFQKRADSIGQAFQMEAQNFKQK